MANGTKLVQMEIPEHTRVNECEDALVLLLTARKPGERMDAVARRLTHTRTDDMIEIARPECTSPLDATETLNLLASIRLTENGAVPEALSVVLKRILAENKAARLGRDPLPLSFQGRVVTILASAALPGEALIDTLRRVVAASRMSMPPGPEEEPTKAREVAMVLKIVGAHRRLGESLTITAHRLSSSDRDMDAIREALVGVQHEPETTLDTVRRLAMRALTWDTDKKPAPEKEPGCNCAAENAKRECTGHPLRVGCSRCSIQPLVATPTTGPGPLAPWTQAHVDKALADFMTTSDALAAGSLVALIDRMYGRGR